MRATLTRRELLERAPATLLAAPLLTIVGCGDGRPAGRATNFGGATMGTSYGVRISDLPTGIDTRELTAEIERRLEQINLQMSTYRADSELSRFNAGGDDGWVEVSPATRNVVDRALATSRLTRGAFDPTVGPLVDLWGFGPTGPRAHAPGDKQIAGAMSRMGFSRIAASPTATALRKADPRLQVDLSGIAKGFGVDEVARLLDAVGIEHYLVEIGGELRSRGLNPNGEPWRVGVEKPGSGRQSVQTVVRLRDAALATSGDYRNFFEQDGQRFAHIIDPRSGRPVDHALASVTVLASSSMEADALSTALMVLGPKAGVELAERGAIAALFIAHDGQRLVETSTGDFRHHVAA
jgi:thiamine biosynthesis lipoprotein